MKEEVEEKVYQVQRKLNKLHDKYDQLKEDNQKKITELQEEKQKEIENRIEKLVEGHHIFKREPPTDKEKNNNAIKELYTILKKYKNNQYLQCIIKQHTDEAPNHQETVSKPTTRKKSKKLSNRPVLTQRDLNTLNEEGWVNDNIIQGILYNITKNLDSVLVLSTYIYTNISNNKLTDRLLGGQNIFKYAEVFIPCHLNNHWVLAYYRPKIEQLDIYDPLQFCRTSRLVGEKIAHWIRKEARCLNRHMTSTITIAIRNDFPIQTDASSCGVFIIHYAQAILDRKGYCSIPSIDTIRRFWKEKMKRYLKTDEEDNIIQID